MIHFLNITHELKWWICSILWYWYPHVNMFRYARLRTTSVYVSAGFLDNVISRGFYQKWHTEVLLQLLKEREVALHPIPISFSNPIFRADRLHRHCASAEIGSRCSDGEVNIQDITTNTNLIVLFRLKCISKIPILIRFQTTYKYGLDWVCKNYGFCTVSAVQTTKN